MHYSHQYQGKQFEMYEALKKFIDQFHLQIQSDPVFGWNNRSIGCQVLEKKNKYWIRVVSEQKWWAQGDWWEGNRAANSIQGISKPKVLITKEYEENDVIYRAELHTFMGDDVCSRSPELRENLDLPTKWWADLRSSLEVLSSYKTTRSATSQEKVTRRFLVFYGDEVNSEVSNWATAHADLHWANLMSPSCSILDWESWGMAPVGYDVAYLYCHSLLVPEIADKVYCIFRDVLDSEDGRIAQLYAITHLLHRIDQGDYMELAGPLHRQASKLHKHSSKPYLEG